MNADKLKLLIAGLVLAGGIAAFYIFPDQSLLLRVLGIVAAAGLAVAVALQTETGQSAWGFLKEARTEVRKVVWPTRKETVQTSLIVVAMVLVVAILLWVMDSVLFWIVSNMMNQGS